MAFIFEDDILIGNHLGLAWCVDGAGYEDNFPTQQPITFGRHPQNDIVLDKPFISRHHGVFHVRDGVLKVLNLSQYTPLMVINGRNVSYVGYNESVRLDIGAEVRLDGVQIHVVATDS